jgi:hypothetical protein
VLLCGYSGCSPISVIHFHASYGGTAFLQESRLLLKRPGMISGCTCYSSTVKRHVLTGRIFRKFPPSTPPTGRLSLVCILSACSSYHAIRSHHSIRDLLHVVASLLPSLSPQPSCTTLLSFGLSAAAPAEYLGCRMSVPRRAPVEVRTRKRGPPQSRRTATAGFTTAPMGARRPPGAAPKSGRRWMVLVVVVVVAAAAAAQQRARLQSPDLKCFQ